MMREHKKMELAPIPLVLWILFKSYRWHRLA
jgi:hypothetical protein